MSDHFVLIDQPDPRTSWAVAPPTRRRLGIRRRVLLTVVGGSAIATVGLLAGHVDAQSRPETAPQAAELSAADAQDLHLIDAATSLYLAAGATIAAAAGLSMGLTRRTGDRR